MNMSCGSAEYDRFAEQVFAPIYPDIAQVIVERTHISQGKLLDLGCGGGQLGFALMDLGIYDASFLDIRPEALEIAKARAQKQGKHGSFHVGDVCAMPFEHASFDLIVSRGSMPFWEEQEPAFREITRILKPGGCAYIGGGLGGRKHVERIRSMVEAGLLPRRDKRRPLPTSAAYLQMFDGLHLQCRVIENEEEGRWFLLQKQD